MAPTRHRVAFREHTGGVSLVPSVRKPPRVPLEDGELIEVVLRGRMTDPTGGGRVTAKAERFVGHRLGTSRWIMLTTRRLLVVAPFPREGDWFDVSYDRRDVSASRGLRHGEVIVVELKTPGGRQILRLPNRTRSEAARLIRALRPAEPTPRRP